jgi:NADH dehydrogenase
MNITIVGGGFGGVKAALELTKLKDITVTLISDKDFFQYYPALYGTATGYSHLQSWVPLSKVFRHNKKVTIIKDTITSIDPERKLLVGKSQSYTYHTCIFSLGVITSYFGIKGLDEYSYSIKSEAEIKRFKQHIHNDMSKKHQLDKHYVIVGAGPTGVELAGAITTYIERLKKHYGIDKRRKIHIDLVEASPRVLSKMSESTSRKVEKRLKSLGVNIQTAKMVQSEDANDIIVSGKPIASTTVVWTSGVTNHPFFKEHEHYFKLAPNGRVLVDDQMQAYKNVYVIGDNAATPYTGLAQTALHDAIFLAKNFKRTQQGLSPLVYSAVMPPVVVPVGEGWAVFEWRKIHLSGWIASMIRKAADFMGYRDVLPLGQALGAWHAQKIIEDESEFDVV